MMASILKNRRFHEIFYTAAAVIVLLVLWKLGSIAVNKEIIVPSPEKTFAEITRIVASQNFLASVINTVQRALTGFGLSLASGMLLGIAGGFFRPAYYLLRPITLVIKAVPTMAMILLALIWLESEKAPILVGFVVIFPVIYESVVQGIRNADKKLVEMMKIYQISWLDKLRDLYIPSVSSYLHGAMSAAMGLNLKIIIAAEVLSQPRISMGTSFQIERANLNTAGVFAWSIITVLIAGLLEQLLKVFQQESNGIGRARLIRWKN